MQHEQYMQHEKLIKQILLGDIDKFEKIVLEFQNLVYTVCLNIVKNPHDAENSAQETFLTAYKFLSTFKGGNFRSWICRIATNKSIDFVRKQSKFVLIADDFDGHGYQSMQEVFEPLESKEQSEKLRQIIANLPEKYSVVIKAFYYREQSVKEISKSLELSERTVETQLYRAKKLIKERWGNEYENT